MTLCLPLEGFGNRLVHHTCSASFVVAMYKFQSGYSGCQTKEI